MSDQIQRLREVAEAATEGGWEASLGWLNRDCPKGCDHPGHLEGPAVSSNAYMPVVDEWSVDAGDAHHIATFDPPTVLELLDRLERAEAAVERVRGLHHASSCPCSVASGLCFTLRALDGSER